MQVYRINTSAWKEEDFYLLTTLTEEQVQSVIAPMVHSERVNDIFYDNDDYITELQKQFPNDEVSMYNEFETLTF
jgi:hypothetical protein